MKTRSYGGDKERIVCKSAAEIKARPPARQTVSPAQTPIFSAALPSSTFSTKMFFRPSGAITEGICSALPHCHAQALVASKALVEIFVIIKFRHLQLETP
eukprot:TRINITY_DN5990_c0_g1_i3.p1 TRINITY_DN5990_c0_g1~~TRINITY_DN5990_c0_g1_i3.p1  ORF type:complete len:100 (+),score=3.35 TRINITY_DN5990_c0_g1_i3:223-522(+)